jgi:hypothetical protein
MILLLTLFYVIGCCKYSITRWEGVSGPHYQVYKYEVLDSAVSSFNFASIVEPPDKLNILPLYLCVCGLENVLTGLCFSLINMPKKCNTINGWIRKYYYISCNCLSWFVDGDPCNLINLAVVVSCSDLHWKESVVS